MPRVQRRRPSRETIGVGKGTVIARRHPRGRAAARHRPEPRHQPPADAHRAGGGQAATAPRSSRSTRCPRRACSGSRTPSEPRGLVGRGTALADLFLPIRVGADLALFQLVNHLLVEARRARRGRARPRVPDRALRRAGRADRAPRPARRRRPAGRHRPRTRRRRPPRRPHRRDATGSSSCWAMGLTQHKASRGRPSARSSTRCSCAAASVEPGAGACPVRGHSNVQGDRTMGIYEQPSDEFLDRLGAAVGFDPPREPGYDTVDAIEAMAEGRGRRVLRHGRQLRGRRPGHRRDGGRPGPLRADRAGLHQAQPLAPVHGGQEALLLPCLGRTERDTTGGREQLVTVEDSMSVVHASRGGTSRRHRTCAARWRSSATWPTAPSGATAVDWVGAGRRLRPHPRPHRSRSCRASRASTSGCGYRAGSPCPTAPVTTARSQPPRGRARLTVNHFEPDRGATGAAAPADDPLPRPVQHDDLRPRRPLPRHPPRPARPPRGDRRPRRARVQATARWSTSSASGATTWSGGLAASAWSPTRRRRGPARPTSRRPTCSCRSAAPPTAAERRPRRPSSCASSDPPD